MDEAPAFDIHCQLWRISRCGGRLKYFAGVRGPVRNPGGQSGACRRRNQDRTRQHGGVGLVGRHPAEQVIGTSTK